MAQDQSPLVAEARVATDAGQLVEALALYHAAAENGEVDAEVQLARLYLEGGAGLETDFAKALVWAERAAEAGDTRGMVYLGKIWMEGLGVNANSETALAWFTRADAQGDGKAARYIGLIALDRGDPVEAAEWFMKGAEGGDITSQYYLGRAYHRGEGVDQDFAAAMQWYSAAAERGDIIASDGMVGMASLYEAGQGVSLDTGRARALYEQAATLGNETAHDALRRLSR
ncbi:Putative beta-lactamase HcpC precursor (plasmid) [Marinibacterium anthonyi]|nr:Putative beta-lactamase HcpC precursor [Marinibacterium anthonyi]